MKTHFPRLKQTVGNGTTRSDFESTPLIRARRDQRLVRTNYETAACAHLNGSFRTAFEDQLRDKRERLAITNLNGITSYEVYLRL